MANANNVEVHVLTGFLTITREEVAYSNLLEIIDKKSRKAIMESVPEGASLLRVIRDVKEQNDEWSVMYTIYYVYYV